MTPILSAMDYICKIPRHGNAIPVSDIYPEATRKVQEIIDPLETAISWLPKGSQSNLVD